MVAWLSHPPGAGTAIKDDGNEEIENTSYEHVANTAFVIIHDPKSKNYYVSAGADTWYAAKAVEGPWTVSKSVPKQISGLVKEEEPEEAPEGAETAVS